jgi:hypothetical protein
MRNSNCLSVNPAIFLQVTERKRRSPPWVSTADEELDLECRGIDADARSIRIPSLFFLGTSLSVTRPGAAPGNAVKDGV